MEIFIRELSQSEVLSLWTARNRGVLTRIARALDLSPHFVRMVYRGEMRSKHLRVEKSLIEAGAPFVAERIAERLKEIA